MENTESIGQRIKMVRGELSQKAFGLRIGLSQTAVTALENDQSEPRLGTFNSIVAAFGVNPEWLRTGSGQTRGRALSPVAVAEPAPDYTSGEATTATLYIEVLKEQVADLKADKTRLLEENHDLRDEVKLLLGKPFGSSDAADDLLDEPSDPTRPPFSGAKPAPKLRVQRRIGFQTASQEE